MILIILALVLLAVLILISADTTTGLNVARVLLFCVFVLTCYCWTQEEYRTLKDRAATIQLHPYPAKSH
jgi:uncharacterized membrane protein YqjE